MTADLPQLKRRRYFVKREGFTAIESGQPSLPNVVELICQFSTGRELYMISKLPHFRELSEHKRDKIFKDYNLWFRNKQFKYSMLRELRCCGYLIREQPREFYLLMDRRRGRGVWID